MKVAVIGLGCVGTVTPACLASDGNEVWGVDVDAAKVDEIRAGPSLVSEPNRRHVESRLPHLEHLLVPIVPEPATALSGAEVAIIATNDEAVLDALLSDSPRHVIDLCDRLCAAVESLSGYEGAGW